MTMSGYDIPKSRFSDTGRILGVTTF